MKLVAPPVFGRIRQRTTWYDVAGSEPAITRAVHPQFVLRMLSWLGSRRIWGKLTKSKALFAILLVASCVCLISALRHPGAQNLSAETAELIAALGPVRPVPGRLVGFPSAPYQSQVPIKISREAAVLVRNFLRAEHSAAHPKSPDGIAILALLSGDLDKAVRDLQQATPHAPDDARLLSNLSAAYLARSLAKMRATDLFLALGSARKAVQIDPGLLEARFNFALALEQNSLSSEAMIAWNEYVRLDPDSPWSDEARDHLNALAAPSQPAPDPKDLNIKSLETARHLISHEPQRVRLYAEKELLADWANEYAEGKSAEASGRLETASLIGEALGEVSGDYMVRDAVASIKPALASPSGKRARALVAGHRLYGEGLELLKQQRDREALEKFRQAAQLLGDAASPFRFRAMVRAATCAKNMLDHEQVLNWLNQAWSGLDAERYPNLAGEVLWMKGVTNSSLADFSAALSLYEAAIPFFQRTGEVENVAFLHYLMAESLRYQGDTEAAWSHRYEALKIGRSHKTSIAFHNALLDAAEAALRQGLPEVALAFQNEMVRNDLEGGTAVSKVEALLRRSRVQHRIGRSSEAEQDLQEAKRWLASMPPGALFDRLASEIQIAAGENLLVSMPRRAAEAFGHGIDLFNSKNRGRLPALLLNRALAWRALGEDGLAERDLEACIGEIEAQYGKSFLDKVRTSYFEQFRRAFEAMIELQNVKKNDPRLGFLYADRFLEDTSTASQTARLGSLPEAQPMLPDDVSVVEYFVGATTVFVWVLDRESFSTVEIPIRPAKLRQDIEALHAGMAARAPARDMEPLLKQLYEALLRPIARKVSLRSSLVIVPDDWLYAVPYAGLIDEETGRYLVEERRISLAPSTHFYLQALQHSRDLHKAGSGMLILGNPAFDRRKLPGFGDLPGAEREAIKVASDFNATPLLRADAKKSVFMTKAHEYGVIHWAGHAKVNPEFPLLSFLLLAPDGSGQPDDTGILYAHEIQRMRFTKTWLAVLAVCGNGEQTPFLGRGTASVAIPFLAAGVPSVVASLWPLQDNRAADFFSDFYSLLKDSGDPLDALRQAQVSALSKADPSLPGSAAWMGFELMGGSSSLRAIASVPGRSN